MWYDPDFKAPPKKRDSQAHSTQSFARSHSILFRLFILVIYFCLHGIKETAYFILGSFTKILHTQGFIPPFLTTSKSRRPQEIFGKRITNFPKLGDPKIDPQHMILLILAAPEQFPLIFGKPPYELSNASPKLPRTLKP